MELWGGGQMSDEGAGAGLIILIIVGLWVFLGTPMRDIRTWTGNATYDDQLDALTDAVKKNKIGMTPDYWLTKTNFAGQPDRVALIFGVIGDREFCEDLANLYMGKYPADRYYCTAANVD